MARNRKRAKERRSRRPQPVTSRARVAGTGADLAEGAPSPLGHAAPDAELADAQLALGAAEALPAEELDGAEELSPEVYGAGDGGDGLPPAPPGLDDGGAAAGGTAAFPAPVRVSPRNRLLAFLEGSWRELQRVQWPDRRQVMQATAVVIGFVIVAGIFLGVADTLASHLMSYILTGTKSVLGWIAIVVIVFSVAGWSFFADRRR